MGDEGGGLSPVNNPRLVKRGHKTDQGGNQNPDPKNCPPPMKNSAILKFVCFSKIW